MSILRKTSQRFFSTDLVERLIGRQAAKHLIKSLERDTRVIDTPTVNVADPLCTDGWEWAVNIDCKPKLSIEEVSSLALQGCNAFDLVEKDVKTLSGGIKDLLGSDHHVLEQCAKYFFEIDGGKKIRPTMVLAVSYALSVNGCRPSNSYNASAQKDVMHASPSQKRLAEITEMIHTASLFHDDVIDKAVTRRSVPSVNQVFGNKLAILGGDFLLSRASVALARLRNLEVVELLSTVIEHLVKGEIMQMRPVVAGQHVNTTASRGIDTLGPVEFYLRKNFYKTASLMGHSCMAAAILGNHSEQQTRAAYLYGTYVGQAFQLIDDALDFEGTTATIGKAPLADLKSGLATAPTLFAAEEFPKLEALIARKFEFPGDIDEALSLVCKSEGLKRCKDLAQVHAERAIEAIEVLQPSEARDALVSLACRVVTRSH